MRILLIRHGQTEGNLTGRIQGPDDPLTDLGRGQARLLGPHLARTYNINHLVSSSLSRASETAEIVTESTGHVISLEPRFAEIHSGNAAGMLWIDWRVANPDLADVWGWNERHADAAWEGGESGRDLYERVFAAWDELVETHVHSKRTVSIVTHGGPIAWLAARLNGDSLDYWPAPYGDIANCSITEVAVSPGGDGRIKRWNLTDHLGDSYAPHISPVASRRNDS